MVISGQLTQIPAKSATDKSERNVMPMRAEQINRLSIVVVIVLSLTALLSVLSGYLHAPLPDEGAAAHIFQLSIVALVPMILLFLATADWTQPCEACDDWHFRPPLWFLRLQPSITSSTTI